MSSFGHFCGRLLLAIQIFIVSPGDAQEPRDRCVLVLESADSSLQPAALREALSEASGVAILSLAEADAETRRMVVVVPAAGPAVVVLREANGESSRAEVARENFVANLAALLGPESQSGQNARSEETTGLPASEDATRESAPSEASPSEVSTVGVTPAESSPAEAPRRTRLVTLAEWDDSAPRSRPTPSARNRGTVLVNWDGSPVRNRTGSLLPWRRPRGADRQNAETSDGLARPPR